MSSRTSFLVRLAGIFLPTLLIFLAHRTRIALAPTADQWDPLMHFLGGASIGWITWRGSRLLEGRGNLPVLPRWALLFAIVAATALAGVLWEFYEYAVFVWLDPSYGLTLSDTLYDLRMDLAGAVALATIVGIGWKRTRKNTVAD